MSDFMIETTYSQWTLQAYRIWDGRLRIDVFNTASGLQIISFYSRRNTIRALLNVCEDLRETFLV